MSDAEDGGAIRVTTLAERPDLIPQVARWTWAEWGQRRGRTLEDTTAHVAKCTATTGIGTCFVLLDGDTPVASARLLADSESLPGHSPWMAGVYVAASHRGRGLATRLVGLIVGAVEDAGFPYVWCYSDSAAGLYRRLWWRDVKRVELRDRHFVLMRRHVC